MCKSWTRYRVVAKKAGVKEGLKGSVFTQKKVAIDTFKTRNREYIRDSLKKTNSNKFPVMILLMDIPEKELKYLAGDELDPYTTEYDLSMDTEYEYNFDRFVTKYILEVESKYFYINKTRLKIRRLWSILY